MFYYMSTNYLLIPAKLTFLLATYFSQNSAGKTYQGLIAVQLSNHRRKTSHTSPRMMCCFYTLPLPGTVCAVMQFSALRLATYCDHSTAWEFPDYDTDDLLGSEYRVEGILQGFSIELTVLCWYS